MVEFVLHGFGESGSAYKAALMLELSKADWELRFVDFFKGETRSPDYLAINPMGEVPVLEHGEVVLSQSSVIQSYIAEQTKCFLPSDEAEAREVARWVAWDNHKFSGYIGTARFLNNFAPKDKRPTGVYEWLSGRLRIGYKILDAHLSTRSWVAGGAPTAADFAICSYLYYPEDFGFERASYPNIDRWLGDISALEHWAHPYDLMKRAF